MALRELRADIVLLQEVRNSPADHHDLLIIDWLARELDMHAFLGPTLLRTDDHYGNACLTRRAPVSWRRHKLSVDGREPRGALELSFDEAFGSIRLIATHLGLRRKERRRQYHTLSEIIAARPAPVTVLGGDFNDLGPPAWFSRATPGEHSRRKTATFPTRWPILSLDRLHVWPPQRLGRLFTVRNDITRVASDHLPVVAEIAPAADGGTSSNE